MSMKKKKEKPAILRVRRKSLTEIGRLSEMVIPNKKKAANKKKCRKPVKRDEE